MRREREEVIPGDRCRIFLPFHPIETGQSDLQLQLFSSNCWHHLYLTSASGMRLLTSSFLSTTHLHNTFQECNQWRLDWPIIDKLNVSQPISCLVNISKMRLLGLYKIVQTTLYALKLKHSSFSFNFMPTCTLKQT